MRDLGFLSRARYFIRLTCYLFLNVLKVEISENLGISCAIFPRDCLFLAVTVLSWSLDLSGRIETEQ